MADKTEKVTNTPEQGQKIVLATVAPDGAVTVPCCEAELISVDVADVDLLLGFSDGTYVIIPNGALDALSDALHTVVFVDKDGSAFDQAHFGGDHITTLGDLFKMVGTTALARAGSLRVVSEKVDAPEGQEATGDEAPAEPTPPPETVFQENTSGKGPGSDPILSTPELLDPVADDPVGPIIPPRPSVFTPGQKVYNIEPTIRLDANITADDVINIAESNPGSLVTITGAVGGSAIIGDSISVTVGSYTASTVVLDDMTFSADIPGDHFVDPAYPNQVDARIDSWDGKTASDLDVYDIDITAPLPTIDLDVMITADDVINVDESLGTVTITGMVNELYGENIAGDQITLMINGNPYYGFVNPDGQTFSIDVPGIALAPTPGVEGAAGSIDARIDSVDIAGNPAFAVDPDGETFTVDTLPPAASIDLDPNITGDGTVNFAESLSNVTITGTVGLDVQDGDTVTLTINNKTYTGTASGGSFSISVAGSDLVAEAGSDFLGAISASVETFDVAGNSTTATSAAESYSVDITLPVPEIYLDAISGDNLINLAEAGAADVAITGRVAGDAQIGDQITITVNGNLISTGFVSSDLTFSINVAGSDLAAVGDGGTGNIVAEVTTAGTSGAAKATTPPEPYTVDLTPPVPIISVDDITTDNIVNIAESNGDVAVTGSVVGGQAGNTVTLTINNIDYSGLVRSDGSFSINVLGSDLLNDYFSGDGSVHARITTFDAADNPGTGSFDKAYSVDSIRPTATIDVDDTALKVGESAQVTITFLEPVIDLTNADLTVENGTLTPISSVDGGITWTATLTPDAPIEDPSNTITLDNVGVTDLAGNTGAGVTNSTIYSIDTIEPTVTDVTVDDLLITDANNGQTLNVSVTFSEVMDTTVDPMLDFVGLDLAGSLFSTGGTWNGVGTVYTETYDILDANVDINIITVDVTGAQDVNGNVILDYTEEAEFSIDTLNPSVIIVDDNIDGIVSFTDIVVNYTLTFSEEVVSISDLDLTITGGTLTGGPVLASDGLSATLSVEAYDKSSADLVVTVNDTIIDLNGNSLVPEVSTLSVDTLNPRVTIVEDNVDGVVSDPDNVVNYTLTFSQEVVSITATDLTITGGVLTAGPILALGGLSATFSVTAFESSNTDLSVTVNNTIVDLTGRLLVPATITLPVDTLNPSVFIAEDNVDGIVSGTDNVVNYTVTFSEEVASVTATDLTIIGGVLTAGPNLAPDSLSATFSVTAFDESTTNLMVTVNDTIVDLNGNLLAPASNTLVVDTLAPKAYATLTDSLITDADNNFSVVVVFNEAMAPSVVPTLVFSPGVSGSLVKNFEGWFNGNRKLVVIYDVIDANVDLSNVTIDIIGGQDANGNPFQSHNAIVEFDIDTLNPSVVVSDDNIDGLVSDADNVVNYTLAFSEEITSISISDLTITGGTLTGGPILASDGLSATFSVTATDESTADLEVTVNNTILDTNGNQLDPAIHTLAVDTIDYFPYFEADLYTSSEFKVTGGSGAPAGSYVDGATSVEHVLAASPTGQATHDRIDGTAGNDVIDYNPLFSADPSQWVKTLHIDFKVFTDLTTIELIADPAITSIPGFSIAGTGLTWDGMNTWALNPDAVMSADLISNGLDLNILYDVTDTGGPVDFDIIVNVDGLKGAIVYNWNETLDFSWREAITEADFDVTDAGNQVMILPRDGLGVDIYAGGGDDIVNAGAGHDIIYGGVGVDTLSGGAGNDILVGGADGDVLNGGAGSDTVSYTGSVDAVNASLFTNSGSGGDAAGDSYSGVENLTGGDGNDTLSGDGNDNVLDGGVGDDTLIGGAALIGDTLIGGLGNDTVSYSGSIDDITASLISNSGSGGDAAGDSYSGIENLTGGDGADTLIGDGNNNVLTGGGAGDDLQGGAGIDTVSFAEASTGVIAALDSSLWMFHSGEALGDTYAQIENMLGSSHDDTLFGDNGDNSLDGGLGNDTLNASAGDDTIYANQGNDIVRGDIGNDTIHISSDGADLPGQIDGGVDTDTLVLENLIDVAGNYDFTDLAGLDSRLENLEILDIREGADPARADANTTIEITGQDILNMVDTGTELTVLADSGDTLDLSAFATEGETYVENTITADHTEYVISDGAGEMARIQWHAA